MNLPRIALIIVFVAIVAAVVISITGLDFAGVAGRTMMGVLAAPPEPPTGTPLDAAPADVPLAMFPALFGFMEARGFAFNPWTVIRGAFGGAFIAVGGVLLVKVLLRGTGS